MNARPPRLFTVGELVTTSMLNTYPEAIPHLVLDRIDDLKDAYLVREVLSEHRAALKSYSDKLASSNITTIVTADLPRELEYWLPAVEGAQPLQYQTIRFQTNEGWSPALLYDAYGQVVPAEQLAASYVSVTIKAQRRWVAFVRRILKKAERLVLRFLRLVSRKLISFLSARCRPQRLYEFLAKQAGWATVLEPRPPSSGLHGSPLLPGVLAA